MVNDKLTIQLQMLKESGSETDYFQLELPGKAHKRETKLDAEDYRKLQRISGIVVTFSDMF